MVAHNLRAVALRETDGGRDRAPLHRSRLPAPASGPGGSHVAESLPAPTEHPLLRRRDGHHARVTFEEVFFDLVYVFAVTQLSHLLLHHLSLMGALETLVL